MPAKLELKGEVFSELTALEEVGKENGKIIWKCRCSCGNHAYRPGAMLVHMDKMGRRQMCEECRKLAGKTKSPEGMKQVKETWLYVGVGDSLEWEEAMEREIAEEMEEEGLLMLDEQLEGARLVASESWSPRQSYVTPIQQRMAYLFPLNGGEDLLWQCAHCEDLYRDVFACVQCGGTVCIECARRERHTHTDEESHTLEEIGTEFKRTRERIRQMEAKALRKLRTKPHGSELMKQYYYR